MVAKDASSTDWMADFQIEAVPEASSRPLSAMRRASPLAVTAIRAMSWVEVVTTDAFVGKNVQLQLYTNYKDI